MSVTRRSEHGGWEDLEVQSVRRLYALDPGETDKNGVEQANTLQPSGGINRDELAELKALRILGIFGYPADGGGTGTRWTVHGEWELSLSPESLLTEMSEFSGPTDLDSDLGTDTIELTRGWETQSPDVLYFLSPHQHGSFQDGATGIGGGGSMHMDHGHVMFDDFGGGPVLDAHDRIYEHLVLEKPESSSDSGFLYVNYQLLWDVFEK